jgi:hypothetical protein
MTKERFINISHEGYEGVEENVPYLKASKWVTEITSYVTYDT